MQDLFVEKPGYVEVSTSVDDIARAREIADHLIESKLAACVHLIPNATSVYIWQDKKEVATEVLITIKTKLNVYGRIAAELKNLHPYDTPEILVKPIIDGSTQYLNWLDKNIAD